MDGAMAAETLNVLDFALQVDYWGWTKAILFYFMLVICAAQTFYPILMIIAMWIRQMGFLAHYFHEVSRDCSNKVMKLTTHDTKPRLTRSLINMEERSSAKS